MTEGLRLGHAFADAMPEMAVEWQAARPPSPQLLALDEGLAGDLGLDASWLRGEGLDFLTGTSLPADARPVAQGYAGFQFGGYSPRLGDGRALLLGEFERPDGGLVDVHLKGSGRTPWARGGDGLAALGPMLREFVIAHAMHALGVPTTRSLAVLATGQPVRREQPQPGGLLVRTAASHLRVGSFQYAAALESPDALRRLADHAIDRHDPDLVDADERYLGLLERTIARQAQLVVQWMHLGFVHGVLNTDNVTISGETIDYGPCAFIDVYDPAAVFSSIDEGGRYAFGNQPAITEWNLARFAESLLPLLHPDLDRAVEIAREALAGFQRELSTAWTAGMRAKLGLPAGLEGALVDDLGTEVYALMEAAPVDHTGFWRALSHSPEAARDQVVDRDRFDAWAERWGALEPDLAAMRRVNPVYIPRNHLVEEALDAAVGGDLGPFDRLVEVLADPFAEQPGAERFAEAAPESFGRYVTFCGT